MESFPLLLELVDLVDEPVVVVFRHVPVLVVLLLVELGSLAVGLSFVEVNFCSVWKIKH